MNICKESIKVGTCAFIFGFTTCTLIFKFYKKTNLNFLSRNDNPTETKDERVFVGTRLHEKNASKPTDMSLVKQYCINALSYGDCVAIAVCADEEGGGKDLVQRVQAAATEAVGPGRITIIKVQPWGAFTPALNALLATAAKEGFGTILFQSMETKLDKSVVKALQSHLDKDDLVVGAALPGHDFSPGVNKVNGRTTPWNTLALWSVEKLSLTGFLPVAEGLKKGLSAGVEEVTAITLLQSIKPTSSNAKLLRLPQVQWETRWKDPDRKKWHDQKMASKISRASGQLQELGLEPGTVVHIDINA